MQKKIASRKLRRTCENCGKHFLKGDVYYRKRIVNVEYDYFTDEPIVSAYEYAICPKCKYHKDQHNKRLAIFRKHCTHPIEFRNTFYGYIPGECVMQPEYDVCMLCGQRY